MASWLGLGNLTTNVFHHSSPRLGGPSSQIRIECYDCTVTADEYEKPPPEEKEQDANSRMEMSSTPAQDVYEIRPPGMPTMYLAHDFQRELERNFTVVQWDRREAGKSFVRGMSPDGMTVSHEISDTIALIDQLRARFHQPKVYLVGFFYGTYLGILVAQRAPERLYAFAASPNVYSGERRPLQRSGHQLLAE
jgi:hypothetical protein